MQSVLSVLPSSLNRLLNRLPESTLAAVEEIRIRERRPLEIVYEGTYGFITRQGTVERSADNAYEPTQEDCEKLLDLITDHSKYALEEQLKKGYLTIAGGHRIGLAGKTVIEHGKVKQIKDISSFNIRIARAVTDVGQHVLTHLIDKSHRTLHHTLIVSPPRQGKTTLVRDLARLVSSGKWPAPQRHWPALKVGIVDERSEIAACVKGVPLFDLGPRTDVLDNCPKAEGMMMMIRSMSPDVLFVDEIGTEEDASAVREALHAGIRVVATAHGRSPSDLQKRPMLTSLLHGRIFKRIVVLSATGRPGRINYICDDESRMIWTQDAAAAAEGRRC